VLTFWGKKEAATAYFKITVWLLKIFFIICYHIFFIFFAEKYLGIFCVANLKGQ